MILNITKTNVYGKCEEISHGHTQTGEHVKAAQDQILILDTTFTILVVVCVFLNIPNYYL